MFASTFPCDVDVGVEFIEVCVEYGVGVFVGFRVL